MKASLPTSMPKELTEADAMPGLEFGVVGRAQIVDVQSKGNEWRIFGVHYRAEAAAFHLCPDLDDTFLHEGHAREQGDQALWQFIHVEFGGCRDALFVFEGFGKSGASTEKGASSAFQKRGAELRLPMQRRGKMFVCIARTESRPQRWRQVSAASAGEKNQTLVRSRLFPKGSELT